MLFYIKSEASIRVRGISGPFIETISFLVHADTRQQARVKYENRVMADHMHMTPESITFDYKEVAEEIS